MAVFEDYDGAIKLAKNPFSTSRTRRIDMRCCFVLENVNEKIIEISHVSTATRSADGLKKNFPTATCKAS